MPIVKVTADVYATIEGSAYRLYVDDTLMTERTFALSPFKNYISECMYIDVPANSKHTVSIKPLKEGALFTIRKVTVNDVIADNTFTV